MNRFWPASLQSLTPYVPGEQAFSDNTIKLNTNEHALMASDRALAILKSVSADQLRRYPDPVSRQLRETIAQRECLSTDHVLVGNGSDEILGFVWQAYLSDGASVPAIPGLTYTFYPVWAQLFAGELAHIPLQADFSLDTERMSEWQGPLVFPNPNAPTGLAIDSGQVEAILASSPDRLVVIDEAYMGFGAQSAAPLIADYDNLIVTRSLSKSHALAGLRVGYALGHPELIEGLRRIKDSFNSYPLDAIAQRVANAALADSDWESSSQALIASYRDSLSSDLEALGFTVLPSQANFVFASHSEASGVSLTRALKADGILVRSWDNDRLRAWVRITVGTPEQQARLVESLSRIVS